MKPTPQSLLTQDPTGLNQLHDIIVPLPAPWWPPAPGWIWVLSSAAILLVIALVWWVAHWQQNRYRREALSILVLLKSKATDTKDYHAALKDLSQLLKRTALTAFPRPDVATLTGTAWFAFLDNTGNTHFSQGLGATLETAIYQPTDHTVDAAQFDSLTSEVRRWIRQHHREPEVTASSRLEAV